VVSKRKFLLQKRPTSFSRKSLAAILTTDSANKKQTTNDHELEGL
jgi:hypothetical protein